MNKANASPKSAAVLTLAIDIGGSHLKAGILDPAGAMANGPARVATPQPATPAAIVEALVELVRPLGRFDRISIGFPGFVRGGRVLTAPNLGTKEWSGFTLPAVLTEKLGKPARMLNDASVQGLGIIAGTGVELVLTLGTGMGWALFYHGMLAPHLEMAQHPARKGKTYDEYVGHAALVAIGPKRWNKRIRRVISVFDTVVRYDTLYLGGGNAKVVTTPLPERVRTASNEAGITGGVRLWDKRLDAQFAKPSAFAPVAEQC